MPPDAKLSPSRALCLLKPAWVHKRGSTNADHQHGDAAQSRTCLVGDGGRRRTRRENGPAVQPQDVVMPDLRLRRDHARSQIRQT